MTWILPGGEVRVSALPGVILAMQEAVTGRWSACSSTDRLLRDILLRDGLIQAIEAGSNSFVATDTGAKWLELTLQASAEI